MNIPMKHEDVVAKLDITERHLDRMIEAHDALQQRLTVAEQRVGNLKSLLRESLEESKECDDYIDRVIAALKELSHDQ